MKDAKRFDTRDWLSQLQRRSGRAGDIVRASLADSRANDGDWRSPREALCEFVGVFYEAQYNELHRKRLPADAFEGRVIDDSNDKEYLRQTASHYVQTPWLHCRAFTLTILLTVLDTELYPLRREVNDPAARNEILARYGVKGVVASMADSTTSLGWRVFWQLMGALYTLGLVVAFLVSVGTGSLVFAIVFGAWLGFRIYRKLTARKIEGKFNSLLHGLQAVRSELALGSFSATRIGERLRELESNGLFVPSVSYDLLALYDRLPADDQVAAPAGLARA